jgi:hypothetical protein
MRRINPKTGKFFKRGDVGEDGRIFFSYVTSGSSTYVYERWFSPEEYNFQINKTKIASVQDHKIRRANPERRAKMLLKGAEKRAKESKSKCTLTVKWIQERIEKNCCELTGINFDLNSDCRYTTNPRGPSIDRIDPKNKNYTPENCRLILSFANRALNECCENDALIFLESMVAGIKRNQNKV